jgi:hypothetical protein
MAWLCAAEVEEGCEEGGNDEEVDRLMMAVERRSPGGVFRGPLASCWVSLSMLRTVGDCRWRFRCEALRSTAGGK